MERLQLSGNKIGPLRGLNAVIKDSYDIEGHHTSNGSPAWRETHAISAKTAPAVQALVNAGASIVGKAVMDEMAYSLEGQNYHYGTPVNPACPGRIPGGSSSGTACGVASGLADIGLGGDTGGSVRVPASFCGIYGIRPTHNRVNISGSCPLAPSFDTGGWFARSATNLQCVGEVLLDKTTERQPCFKKWIVSTDAFELSDEIATKGIYSNLSKHIEKIEGILGGSPTEILLAPKSVLNPTDNSQTSDLPEWMQVFRICQAWEIWQTHGRWIQDENPSFGPGIKERFMMASRITEQEFAIAKKKRRLISDYLDKTLKDCILTIPTTAGPAPLIGLPSAEMDAFRARLLQLTCIAGLAGLPQVSIPISRVDNCPIGLSLVGPKGSDESLLAITIQMEQLLSSL